MLIYFYVLILLGILDGNAMDDNIMIRESVESDALEVEKLRIRCWKKHFSGIIDEGFLENLNPESSYKGRQAAIATQKNIHLVAVRQGQIIGLSDAGAKRGVPNSSSDGEIYSLYIDEQYRRQRVGALLFERQCDLLRERGYENITIWVLKDNTSGRNFYIKQGGILSGEEYSKIGNKEYLQVSYKWVFKKYG